MEMDGKKIFLDPMLGSVPAPHPLLGSKRFNDTLPMPIEDLPDLDAILISHDHYDHLDYGSIQKLSERTGHFFVPLGVGAHIREWGVPDEKITEMDWWEEVNFEGITLVSTPARHFSGRGVLDRYSSLWCSWVIKGNEKAIFFGGDSGYDKSFKEIGKKYGPFDFAMLECGQYDEQWPDIHMMPQETVQANIGLKSNLLMPIHWGRSS
jgi:L-ascorbate metabolism protein UlaG (beta-lactamase superfamily)